MNRYANNVDKILFYSKTNDNNFKTPLHKLSQKELLKKYNRVDEKGKSYKSEPLELPAMMARPNLVFEFMGYTPRYGWMMEEPKLKKLKANNTTNTIQNATEINLALFILLLILFILLLWIIVNLLPEIITLFCLASQDILI